MPVPSCKSLTPVKHLTSFFFLETRADQQKVASHEAPFKDAFTYNIDVSRHVHARGCSILAGNGSPSVSVDGLSPYSPGSVHEHKCHASPAYGPGHHSPPYYQVASQQWAAAAYHDGEGYPDGVEYDLAPGAPGTPVTPGTPSEAAFPVPYRTRSLCRHSIRDRPSHNVVAAGSNAAAVAAAATTYPYTGGPDLNTTALAYRPAPLVTSSGSYPAIQAPVEVPTDSRSPMPHSLVATPAGMAPTYREVTNGYTHANSSRRASPATTTTTTTTTVATAPSPAAAYSPYEADLPAYNLAPTPRRGADSECEHHTPECHYRFVDTTAFRNSSGPVEPPTADANVGAVTVVAVPASPTEGNLGPRGGAAGRGSAKNKSPSATG